MARAGQFAILKHPLEAPDYRHLPLGKQWVLSWHERLPVYCGKDQRALLIGYAWQTLPEREAPPAELEKLLSKWGGVPSTAEILSMEESWSGRYVLICGSTVFLDASAMLGVYYSSEGISSDASLLACEKGREEQIYQCGLVMNWLPGPLTHYEGVCRLLPSQIYDYQRQSLSSKQLLSQSLEPIKNEAALIERFTEIFCHSLKNMAALFPDRKLFLALTGGYDSRSLFALARKAGIDFIAYTLEHDDMLVGDIEIPRLLCEKTGIPYTYIPRDRRMYSPEREKAYNAYVSGMVRDEDRVFYAYNQYQQLTAPYGDAVLLRSSIWENTIEKFRRLFREDGPNEEFYPYFELAEGSLEKRSMAAYFEWCADHSQPGVNASNRFYWEQREGCWLSSIEQGFDVMDHVLTLQPVNCRLMMTMLFWFPREDRLVKRHQAKIINYACPEIQAVPYANEKVQGEPLLLYLRHKAAIAVRRLKIQGIRKTILTYISIFQHRAEQKKLEKEIHMNGEEK